MLAPAAAPAAPLPTMSAGSRLLLAVESLCSTLQLPYSLRGAHLVVGGRMFGGTLIKSGRYHFADATSLARFLRLNVTQQQGVLTFSAPQLAPQPLAGSAPAPDVLSGLRSTLLAVLNDHRRSEGLAPFGGDAYAQQAAQFQAEDMQRSGVMRHEDSSRRTPIDRFFAFGGRAPLYAENVGYFGLDVDDFASRWAALQRLDEAMMAERAPDDGHRAVILSPQYDAVGIGIAVGPNGLFVAEDFVGYEPPQAPQIVYNNP